MASLTLQELIDNRLTPRLGLIQRVEAWNHLARQTDTNGTVRFPYDKWLSSPSPEYYKNGSIFTPNTIDLTTGIATISGLDPGDEIFANYTFNYFSNTDLQNFYKLALSRLNNTGSATSFTFDDSSAGTSSNVPIDMEDYLTSYAYLLCLQTILVDLMSWRASLIWTNPSALSGLVQGIISQLDSYIMSVALTVKGRRFITPHMSSSGRYSVPAQVGDHNWQQYSIIRT